MDAPPPPGSRMRKLVPRPITNASKYIWDSAALRRPNRIVPAKVPPPRRGAESPPSCRTVVAPDLLRVTNSRIEVHTQVVDRFLDQVRIFIARVTELHRWHAYEQHAPLEWL